MTATRPLMTEFFMPVQVQTADDTEDHLSRVAVSGIYGLASIVGIKVFASDEDARAFIDAQPAEMKDKGVVYVRFTAEVVGVDAGKEADNG